MTVERAQFAELAEGAKSLTNEDMADYCAQMLEISGALSKSLVDMHAKVRNVTEMAIAISLCLQHRALVCASTEDAAERETTKALIAKANEILAAK